MLSDFWKAIGGKLADRWAAASSQALVFWLGGLLAWISGHGGLHELTTFTDWLNRQSAPVQVATMIIVLLGLTASAVIVQRLTLPALRLLEGYWPSWLGPLRQRLISRVERRAEADDDTWQQLAPHVQPPALPSAELLAAFARVDSARRRRPNIANRYMPTRIGNILRAAESWPVDKYGLDAVAVWPRLWLVLPEATRQQLASARTALDSAVAVSIWGLLFCAFTAWSPLALPVGLVVTAACITFWIPTRAELYGDLLEAAYDLYRADLYQQLRWPLPVNPEQEHSQGQQLTSYLWRGSDTAEPNFKPPP
jgi:hypothetical protein